MKALLLLAAFACATFAFAGNALAATRTVDNSGVCSDVSGMPYCTIQAAVAAAGANDTIQVAAGTYAAPITIDKPLTLLGDPGSTATGPGPNAPVIDGGGLVVDGFDLADGVSNVTISGFEIRNLGASDWTDGSGVGVQAYVPSTHDVTVSHNWFHDVGYGVLVGNDGSSAHYALGTHTGWTISNNVAEGLYSVGFELTDTSDSSIQNNVIHLGDGPVLDPYGYGPIGVFSWTRLNESNLTVSGNTIDGTQHGFPAIYIYARSDLPSGSVANPTLDGLFIHNNLLTSTPGASQVAGAEGQVAVRDRGTGTVTGVVVTNNSLLSLNNGTAATVDASSNWWGQASGPAAGQTMGSVTTTPWIATYFNDPAHFGPDMTFGTADDDPGFWPLTGNETKHSVLASVNDALATAANKHDADKLKQASTALTASLDPSLWVDGNHLVAKGGEKVFQKEKEAVQKLTKLIKDKNSGLDDATLQGWIDTLISVDRGLAVTAIGDAVLLGADGKQINEATKEIQAGDDAKKDPDAITHYENAWKKAQEAVKHL
jgi:hypothetical protein